MKKYIYIAGYGRSGSTLLSIMLDNISGITSIGEVGGLARYIGVKGRECSCTRPYLDCPVWGSIIKNIPGGLSYIKQMGITQYNIERWNRIPNIYMNNKALKKYAEKVGKFTETIYEQLNSSVVVDSSKCSYDYMWRALALQEIEDFDIFIIHLVRDVEGVVSSRKKGKNSSLERGSRGKPSPLASAAGFVGWMTANLAASYMRHQLNTCQSIVVRYTDLIRSPEDELRRIVERAQLPGIDSDSVFSRGEALKVGHLVGGNRMARKNESIEVRTPQCMTVELSSIEKLASICASGVVSRALEE